MTEAQEKKLNELRKFRLWYTAKDITESMLGSAVKVVIISNTDNRHVYYISRNGTLARKPEA